MESSTDARLEALEQRVAALEAARPGGEAQPAAPSAHDPEVFWVLEGLAARRPGAGTVVYAGSLTVPDGGEVVWQYGADTDELLDRPWDDVAPTLAALGSPVRMQILRAVLNGARTASDLLTELGGGTTGQIYHHLNQLTAGGWLTTAARGQYVVPADRVVPLLAVVTAAGGTR
ncbi:helix-turn-helix domain-containing protein [Mumia qirimensis]|uniref:helix-turn-helix domain-containing protein n=1 Tax=Mumia qirimensis TaxID=3234852 RepID=UPI00351D3E6D